MINLFKVLSQTEPVSIKKQDGSEMKKSIVHLQEFGGEHENTFAASLLGNQVKFHKDDLVLCSLRFSTHEYGANLYQDIIIKDIIKLTPNQPF